jgi:hypothetical protein
MILRPLSNSVDLLGVYYALNKCWWAAVITFFWAVWVIPGIGQGLRPDRGARELANPPDCRIGDQLEELSDTDAFRLAKAVVKLCWFSSLPTFLLFRLHGSTWYVAVIASLGAALLFGPLLPFILFGSTVLARRKAKITADTGTTRDMSL